MKRFVLPLVSLFCTGLAACSDGNPGIEPASMAKNRSVLDMLNGPNVDGVEKTLLDSAQAAEAEGSMSKAVAIYQQLHDRKPDNREWTLAFAHALRKNEACNDSLALFEDLIKKDAKDADALEGKGMCLMAIGEGKEAGQVFTQVLEVDPNRWRTLNAVGVLFAGKAKVPEAIAYFEKAASVDSSQIAVMNNLGLVYLLDKRYDQAIETFTRAQKRLPSKSPDKARIDMNLALAYALSGDMDNAQKYAKPHVSEAGLYNNLGFFAKLSKDEQLARDYLNMALSKSSVYYKKAWDNLSTISRSHVDHEVNEYGVKVQNNPNAPRKATVPAAKPAAKNLSKNEPAKAGATKADVVKITPTKQDALELEPVGEPAPAATSMGDREAKRKEAEASLVQPKFKELTPPTVEPINKPAEPKAEANPEDSVKTTATTEEAEGSSWAEKKYKDLSPRADAKLESPESSSLERIEPPEENRLAPNKESWFQ